LILGIPKATGNNDAKANAITIPNDVVDQNSGLTRFSETNPVQPNPFWFTTVNPKPAAVAISQPDKLIQLNDL
jgi:hypothetical protein